MEIAKIWNLRGVVHSKISFLKDWPGDVSRLLTTAMVTLSKNFEK